MTGSPTRETRVLHAGFLALLLVSLCGLAVALIAMFLLSSRALERLAPVLGVMGVGLLTAAAGLGATLVLQRGRLVRLMRTAVALLVAAAACWVAFLSVAAARGADAWPEAAGPLLRMAATLSIPALTLVFVGQLLAPRTKRPWAIWTGRIAAANAVLFAAAMTHLLWTSWWRPFEAIVGGVSGFWGMFTFAAMAVAAALGRRKPSRKQRGAPDSVSQQARLRLTCPRCGAEQELPGGLTRCEDCRQALHVELEEPRCECGYLLYQLQGDRCPECGRAIAEAQPGPPAPP